MQSPPQLPRPSSALVHQTAHDLRAMCAADNARCKFLRGYLGHAALRLSWNAHAVDRLAPPGARWLDIGSFGVEALWLLNRRHDVRANAVSYEGDYLSLQGGRIVTGADAGTGTARLRIDRADVERDRLPYDDGAFDLVTCFECIEHLRATPKPMLDEIFRVLAPTGRLLLTTPNIVGSRAMIRLLAGKHPQENPRYHREAKYGIVHPKEYTLRELVALLEGRGLETIHRTSLYFRRRSWVDFAAAGVACVTRPLGGMLLGLGPQPVVVGDNLIVVAQKHTRARDEWPPLVFEPDPFPNRAAPRSDVLSKK